MGRIADGFLFINKSAHSASLSHSDVAEEKFFIQSYVQSKYRKKLPRPKQHPDRPKNDAALRQNAISQSPQASKDLLIVTSSEPRDDSLVILSRAVPAENGIDPFHCTPVIIDACTYRLLQYPFSGFVETTFRAESLGLQYQTSLSPNKFRHRHAVTERLRRCINDEMLMYATLAYCSSSIRFTKSGIREERPPEFYMLKAIEILRSRLQQPDPVDAWLIVSIYALSVSEMWAGNHEASTAHLKIIRHFIPQVGGITQLEPYVMESLILGDKYLSLGYLARGQSVPPILPLDWDPGHMSPMRVQKLQLKPNPELEQFAAGFLALGDEVLTHEIRTIVADLVACLQIAHSICNLPTTDVVDERWLFLRHQALIYRLLSTPTTTMVQECVRLALLVWILKVTKYFGAQRCSRSLLPHLRATLLKVEGWVVFANVELLFWIVCVGAVAADGTADRDWFVRQTARQATSLGLGIGEDQFKRALSRWLFLKSEMSIQITRLVCAVQEMQIAALGVLGSDLDTPDFGDPGAEPEILGYNSTLLNTLDVGHIADDMAYTTLAPSRELLERAIP